MTIAIVLGGSRSNIAEMHEARRLAPAASIIAINDALRACPERCAAFVTLHPEKAGKEFLRGVSREGLAMFSHRPGLGYAPQLVRERWAGSSGLYAVQVALSHLGHSGIILAGIPMRADAGHIAQPGPWSIIHVERYQRSWIEASPVIAPHVRSMSGWTREQFGEPDAKWIKAMSRAPAAVHALT